MIGWTELLCAWESGHLNLFTDSFSIWTISMIKKCSHVLMHICCSFYSCMCIFFLCMCVFVSIYY